MPVGTCTANTLQEETKKQILLAINHLYLAALEHDDFGFAEVTVVAMLAHLQTTYGWLTRAALETNRASIATVWTPDDPIETLWEKLHKIQHVATAGGELLADNTIVELAFVMFKDTGVFTTACDMWRVCPEAEKTFPNFCTHFTHKSEERIQSLTATNAGYHGANAASSTMYSANAITIVPTQQQQPKHQTQQQTNSVPHITTNDSTIMYYCWTHGLGLNSNHTSANCQHPTTGHCLNATHQHAGGQQHDHDRRPPMLPCCQVTAWAADNKQE